MPNSDGRLVLAPDSKLHDDVTQAQHCHLTLQMSVAKQSIRTLHVRRHQLTSPLRSDKWADNVGLRESVPNTGSTAVTAAVSA
jgi:hypothetical protein